MTHPSLPPISPEQLRLALDKWEIAELVQRERLCRDVGDWDGVADTYTDDAIIKTTWFEGNAKAFAMASKEMAAKGRHSKHPVTPVSVRVHGDRALVESRGQIQFRTTVRDVAVDLTQFVRFISRVERTGSGWLLASFEGIYERGTASTVNPNESFPVEWSEVEAASPRTSYQLWAWSHTLRDYPPTPDDLLGDDEPEALQTFLDAQERWLLRD